MSADHYQGSTKARPEIPGAEVERCLTQNHSKMEEYRLIRNRDEELICEGSFYECLGHFLRLCPFSFIDHHKYTYETYRIEPTGFSI